MSDIREMPPYGEPDEHQYEEYRAECATCADRDSCDIEEEFDLGASVVRLSLQQVGCTEAPRSRYEAYAMLQEKREKAEKLVAKLPDTMKEIWKEVKNGDTDVIAAYARQMESDTRAAAVAYMELSALANLSGRLEE